METKQTVGVSADHGFSTAGAPPPTALSAELARQGLHDEQIQRVQDSTGDSENPQPPPVTQGNSPLLMNVKREDREQAKGPERVALTADEMRNVNLHKIGTFTLAEIAAAETQPVEIETATGNLTESSQVRAMDVTASGQSTTGPGKLAAGQELIDSPTSSHSAGGESKGTTEPDPAKLATSTEEGDGDVTKARGHLPESFPGIAPLEAAGEATYAKVRARVQADTLTQIEGIGDATAEKIKEALADADKAVDSGKPQE